MRNSRDLDGGDMRPGMRWETKFWTWLEVGRDMDGGEIRIHWPGYRWYSTYMRKVTRIWGPKCKRGRYWMEGRRTFWDLQVFVRGPESWNAIPMNRKELIHSRDWGEMQMSGHGWRWNATWMEVRCDYRGLGGGETGCGWRWYSYLDLYGDVMEPEWRLATYD